MNRETKLHLASLLKLLMELPVEPSPEQVAKLQAQATIFMTWFGQPTCQATVVRHCEDEGYLCGKRCELGQDLCPEHWES